MKTTTKNRDDGSLGLIPQIFVLAIVGGLCWVGSANASTANWLPGWWHVRPILTQIPVQQSSQSVEQPAATFIVRFNNEPDVDDICKNYRRDPESAKSNFSAWAANYPQLRGLILTRASYSGEVILELPQNDPTARTPSQVLATIQSLDNVAYAEIDATAQSRAGR